MGASSSRPDEAGRQAIAAAETGDVDRLRELVPERVAVDHLDEHGNPLLVVAANGAEVECVAYLLSVGARVDQPNPRGLTALMGASMDGAGLPAAQVLIRAGADVNAASAQGDSVLWGCLFSPDSDPAVLELLIESGADPTERSVHGELPVEVAEPRFVEVLLRYGGGPEPPNA